MNKVILMGRLVRDPMVSTAKTGLKVARYSLAVDRRVRKEAEQTADFVSVVAFDKSADFAEKYLQKGIKILVNGHIQTGSYVKDGQTVYTTDVIVEDQEFCESKRTADPYNTSGNNSPGGFISIPDSVCDERTGSTYCKKYMNKN